MPRCTDRDCENNVPAAAKRRIMRLKDIIAMIKERIVHVFTPKESDIFNLTLSTMNPCGPLTDEEAADLMAYIDSFHSEEEERDPDILE